MKASELRIGNLVYDIGGIPAKIIRLTEGFLAGNVFKTLVHVY